MGNSCYRVGMKTTWAVAERECEGLGSSLASVWDKRELCLLSRNQEGLGLGAEGAWGGAVGSGVAALLRNVSGAIRLEVAKSTGAEKVALCRAGLGDSACWDGWTQSGSSCLRLFDSSPVTFEAAKGECAKLGATLASFTELSEFSSLS